MREFSKVGVNLWRSGRFKKLCSDARLLHVYYLTSPHQTSVGCARIPDAYAAADLGWDVEKYIQARQALEDAELISVDRETEEIFVCRWFKHNPPTNSKHAAGQEKAIAQIESERLREAAQAEFYEVKPARRQPDF